jgi:hypothetical protein
MGIRILLSALVAGGLAWFAPPVSAQFYPGYGGGWGGTNGSAALLGSDYRQATAMQLKAQNTLAGDQRTMAQNSMVQSGIRNTLSSQAQSRTDAILGQQQATQDWWFQHQAQQMNQQRSTGFVAGGSSYPSGLAPGGAPPPVATDIIKWPPLLQEQCFASERTKIEAPYRRTPPKLSLPLATDYATMTRAVDDMKAVLQWRLQEGVNSDDYNTARSFLEQLGQEIASRAPAATPGAG